MSNQLLHFVIPVIRRSGDVRDSTRTVPRRRQRDGAQAGAGPPGGGGEGRLEVAQRGIYNGPIFVV